jgi:hypothetical protein
MKLLGNVLFYSFIAFLLYCAYAFVFTSDDAITIERLQAEAAEPYTLRNIDIAAIEALKDEPKIKSIYHTKGILYVGVYDDDTPRHGYAGYVCQVLNDYHSSFDEVRVVRFNSSEDPESLGKFGVLLGREYCDFKKR